MKIHDIQKEIKWITKNPSTFDLLNKEIGVEPRKKGQKRNMSLDNLSSEDERPEWDFGPPQSAPIFLRQSIWGHIVVVL